MGQLSKKTVLFGSVFIFLFSISLVFVVFTISKKPHRTFLFPHAQNHKIYFEKRNLQLQKNNEDNILYYVKEFLLGPIDLDYVRVLPKDTKIISLMLRKRILYINFSHHILFPNDNLFMSFEEKIELLKKAINFNFSGIKNIKIFVEGEIPVGITEKK
jgi:hypothetical protein